MAYSPKSQKKYNDKCEIVRIKYIPADMQDYLRLQNYLTQNDISITHYLKQLIKADLDSKGVPYPDNTEIDID